MSKEKEAIFISPNNLGSYRSAQIRDENLAIGTLSATLTEAGRSAEMIDARLYNLAPKEVFAEIEITLPKIVGVTMISEASAQWVRELVDHIRNSGMNTHICLGGYYPSLQPEKALRIVKGADSVVVGEGENTLIELARRVKESRTLDGVAGTVFRNEDGRIIYNSRRPLIKDLDTIPLPLRYAKANEITENLLEGSRGCFGRCTFCAIKPHFNANAPLSWRGKSPERIVEEIKSLIRRNPDNRRIRFVDPNFLGTSSAQHQQRAIRIADLIKSNLPEVELYAETRAVDVLGNHATLVALREAGLKELYIGVESGSQRVLKYMHKGVSLDQIRRALSILQEVGINYQYGFMMITPWTEEQDVRDNISFLREIGFVQFDKLFHEMDLIPGTPSVGQAAKISKIRKRGDNGYFTYGSTELVSKIRALGDHLSTNYPQLLERLWYLYKDTQVHCQNGVTGSQELMRDLSNFFLDVFEQSLKMINEGEEIEVIAQSTTRAFQENVSKFESGLTGKIKFPRT